MRRWPFPGLLLSFFVAPAFQSAAPLSEHAIERVAFGSCVLQGRPQPIWSAIRDVNPDVFIFGGDNIYADTRDAAIIRQKYSSLGSQPGFVQLKSLLRSKGPNRLLATWDDHDYGENDGYRTFPGRQQSRELFLEFFEVQRDSDRRRHDGIYDSTMFGPEGRRLQIILLDTRYFRDAFDLREDALSPGSKKGLSYKPTADRNRTMLGREQWIWLEHQMKQPAEMRLLVSSIPFVAEDYTSESWVMMPHEKERLLALIASTGNTLVLSGDRHYTELSRMNFKQNGKSYAIYDFTSSGLNRVWPGGALQKNRYRIGDARAEHNFGLIKIEYGDDPAFVLQSLTETGKLLFSRRIRRSELLPRQGSITKRIGFPLRSSRA